MALCADIADYYADKAETFLQPRPLEAVHGQAYYVKQATGVLIAVEPWNFPFYQKLLTLHWYMGKLFDMS